MTETKKVALITGAANGIGEASARMFAKRGYAVVMLDVVDRGADVAREIQDGGGTCDFMIGDVAVESDVVKAVEATVKKHGRIDVLNNNAGIVIVRPLDEIKWEEYRRVVDVNLGGIFLMCKHTIPIMKKQNGGAIVNMGSVSGHVGQIDHSVYGATKGAVIAITRALAWELAPWNIRVNSVSPGSVDTPMLRSDIKIESEKTGKPFDEVKKIREAEQAFKRWADPSEIAESIFFLSGDTASFITGTDLLVDCGWVAK
ncbi:MAG: SDR family oxidoreductase [Deltaproteobacteria bacterium]|nr:SDR family oxidoreductase [Candidatus Zymogenaceae bacterium]